MLLRFPLVELSKGLPALATSLSSEAPHLAMLAIGKEMEAEAGLFKPSVG